MYQFLDNKDYIKYIPVCSKCGEPIPKDESIYVIENLYESTDKDDKNLIKCKDYEVYPNTCKKCGAHFEYVVNACTPEVIKCEI